MKRVFMVMIGAVLVGAVALSWVMTSSADPGSASGAAPAAGESSATGSVEAMPEETQTVLLRVEGMTCGGCAISARGVLKKLEGVREADVSYEEELAVVTYDSRKITPDRMIEALDQDLGYTAMVLESAGS